MTIDLGFVAASSFSSAAFTAGGFYLLTNWRLKRLESQQGKNDDTRESLIRIAANVEELRANVDELLRMRRREHKNDTAC